MLETIFTHRFRKDLERMQRRGKDAEKLKAVIARLVAQEPLEIKHRDHPLKGEYTSRRECHIEPDWLLIYKVEKDYIIFERSGSHADLFE
jgi:mRNA interferase YafQ